MSSISETFQITRLNGGMGSNIKVFHVGEVQGRKNLRKHLRKPLSPKKENGNSLKLSRNTDRISSSSSRSPERSGRQSNDELKSSH